MSGAARWYALAFVGLLGLAAGCDGWKATPDLPAAATADRFVTVVVGDGPGGLRLSVSPPTPLARVAARAGAALRQPLVGTHVQDHPPLASEEAAAGQLDSPTITANAVQGDDHGKWCVTSIAAGLLVESRCVVLTDRLHVAPRRAGQSGGHAQALEAVGVVRLRAVGPSAEVQVVAPDGRSTTTTVRL